MAPGTLAISAARRTPLSASGVRSSAFILQTLDSTLLPSERGEQGADVRAEQLRLLDRGEVAAAGHDRPPAHVVEAFGPLPRRVALRGEVAREDGDPRRHTDDVV